ncbi:hypothetical protein HYT26_01265 [Candidatus Pacearchaeota archaeon]|nr:hypothetical protein [Candidatus Pacearchaeota archaeon]
MLKPQELFHVIIAILVFAFVISFTQGAKAFIWALLYSFLIIIINVEAKKAAAYYYETGIRIKTWHFQRYGVFPSSYFTTQIPIGIILPVLLSIVSLGYAKWMAFLQFDSMPLKQKAAKRHYGDRFSELVEKHLAFIAAFGILGNIILAIVFALFNLGDLARLSIYYGLFNILPVSQLDGTKIFFWSWRLWLFMLALLVASWLFLIPF